MVGGGASALVTVAVYLSAASAHNALVVAAGASPRSYMQQQSTSFILNAPRRRHRGARLSGKSGAVHAEPDAKRCPSSKTPSCGLGSKDAVFSMVWACDKSVFETIVYSQKARNAVTGLMPAANTMGPITSQSEMKF